jgi:hypothetical protein
MTTATSVQNPYPGLRPFRTDEEHLFFGREGQSEAIARRLRENRFLAVVGVSGSGKSSLIRAGLMAFLHRGYMKGASSRWRMAILRPGSDPIGNLARELNHPEVLGVAGASAEEAATDEIMLEVTLRRSGLGLAEAVRLARLPKEDNVLVIVDQFEELFRFADAPGALRNEEDAAAFVKLLLEAAGRTELPVFVVITMRSEFIGECARFHDLPEAVTAGLHLIPRLTRERRRDAILKPAALIGAQLTPRLVNRLLNDCGDDPGQLPLLQHALMRTWSYWEGHHGRPAPPIDLEDYAAIGGMKDALSQHADEAYAELRDERQREIAKRLFQCLTARGAENLETRRPTKVAEIAAVAGAPVPEVLPVADCFRREGRSFLMPPPDIRLDGDSVLDISHESLIRGWRQMAGWVDEESEWAQHYRKLAERAADHAHGRAGLLRDPELSIALDWRNNAKPNDAWAKRYHPDFDGAMAFLDASEKARDAEEAEKERQRSEELRRARKHLAVVGSLLGVAFIALIIAAIALHSRKKALNDLSSTNARLTSMNESLNAALKEAQRQKSRADQKELGYQQEARVARQEQAEAVQRADEAAKAEGAAVQAATQGLESFLSLPSSIKNQREVQTAYEQVLVADNGTQHTILGLDRNSQEALFLGREVWVSLIALHLKQGRRDQAALECHQYEKQAREKYGSDPKDYFKRALGAALLSGLGVQEVALGNREAALADLRDAARIADALGNPSRANGPDADLAWRLRRSAYQGAAIIEQDYGNDSGAEENWRKAVRVLEDYGRMGTAGQHSRRQLSIRALPMLFDDVQQLADVRGKLKGEQAQVKTYSDAIRVAELWSGSAPRSSTGVADPTLDDVLWLYIYRGDVYFQSKEYGNAQRDYEAAASKLQAFGPKWQYRGWDAAALGRRRGNVWYEQAVDLGDKDPQAKKRYLDQALQFHQQGLLEEEKLGKSAQQQSNLARSEVDLLFDYAALRDTKGVIQHFHGAFEAYQSAVRLDPTDENKLGFEYTRRMQAKYSSQSSPADALRYYNEGAAALKTLRQPNAESKKRLASDLENAADLEGQLGQLKPGIKDYGDAIKVESDAVGLTANGGLPDATTMDSILWMCIHKGDLERRSREYLAAERSYSSARNLAERLDPRNETARFDRAAVDERFGSLWRERANTETDPRAVTDDLKRAIGFHIQSLAQFRRIEAQQSNAHNVRSVAIEEHLVGGDYLALNQLGQARRHYQAELEDYEKAAKLESGDEATRNVASAYDDLWGVEDKAGNHLSARDALDRKIQLLKPLADLKDAASEDKNRVAAALGNRSWEDLLIGDFGRGVKDAQQGFNYDTTQVWILTNEAHGYLFSGQPAQAEVIYFSYMNYRALPGDPASKTFCQGVLDDFSNFETLRPPGMDLTQMREVRGLLQKQSACQQPTRLAGAATRQN